MKKLLIVVSVAMAISMQSKAQKQIDYIVFYKFCRYNGLNFILNGDYVKRTKY